jgi:osmotically-inducible protein OsmY
MNRFDTEEERRERGRGGSGLRNSEAYEGGYGGREYESGRRQGEYSDARWGSDYGDTEAGRSFGNRWDRGYEDRGGYEGGGNWRGQNRGGMWRGEQYGRWGNEPREWQGSRQGYRQSYEPNWQGSPSRYEVGERSNWQGNPSYNQFEGQQYGRGGERGYYQSEGLSPDYASSGWGSGGYGSYGGTSWQSGQQGMQRERGRFTGKGPRGYTRSDQRIEEDINERLTQDPDVDASEIHVKVQNGEVTLTGTVDERHAKRRAEDCAEAVSGVKQVHNQIRVETGSESSQSTSQSSRRGQGRERESGQEHHEMVGSGKR